MIKLIKNKLNSTCGASMVMAYFAFLLVTMVSLVIVSAALTNAKRLEKERQYEQAYLTGQSVANIIVNAIVAEPTDDVYKKTENAVSVYHYKDTDAEGSAVSYDCIADGTKMAGFGSVLADMCKKRDEEICEYLINRASNPAQQVVLTKQEYEVALSSTLSPIPDGFSDVQAQLAGTKVKFIMPAKNNTSKCYDMYVAIRVPLGYDSEGHEIGNPYSYVIKFSGAPTDPVESDGEGLTIDDYVYVYWTSATSIRSNDESF